MKKYYLLLELAIDKEDALCILPARFPLFSKFGGSQEKELVDVSFSRRRSASLRNFPNRYIAS